MKNDIKFKKVFESKMLKDTNGDPLIFYTLVDASQYHLSRYVAASAQNIYSESGLTKSILAKICSEMTNAINNKKLDEVAVWVNNIKARISYPVDEDASLRMAMIYHFVEGENPDKCENHWTEWKLKQIKNDPEAYSFFLPIGLAYTPIYREYLEEISEASLMERKSMIQMLTPQHQL